MKRPTLLHPARCVAKIGSIGVEHGRPLNPEVVAADVAPVLKERDA